MGPAGTKIASSKGLSWFVKDYNLSRRGITNFKLNLVIKLRFQFGNLVPPFHHANSIPGGPAGTAPKGGAAEIFVKIDPLKFFKGFNSVKIKMVKGAFFCGVFMKQGKGWRG